MMIKLIATLNFKSPVGGMEAKDIDLGHTVLAPALHEAASRLIRSMDKAPDYVIDWTEVTITIRREK